MAPRREEPNPDEPHSWREYRLKLLDLVQKHEEELGKLHDAVLEMAVLNKARSAKWGWIGGIVGSIIGSIVTALLIKLIP